MERMDDEKLVRGWIHIPRAYFFEAGIRDAIQEYIVAYREYGMTIDVTVDNMPGCVFNIFNHLIKGHGLEVYEKQEQLTTDS